MPDKRTDITDAEAIYAVSKAGFRPFDCSRQALRRETLAVLSGAGLARPHPSQPNVRRPAKVVDFQSARKRPDPEGEKVR